MGEVTEEVGIPKQEEVDIPKNENNSGSEKKGEDGKAIEIISVEEPKPLQMEKKIEVETTTTSEVDWDKINQQKHLESENEEKLKETNLTLNFSIISGLDSIKYFYDAVTKSEDPESQMKERGSTGLKNWMKMFFTCGWINGLKKESTEEKEKLLKVLKIGLDLKDSNHYNLLFSIYCKLMNQKTQPGLIGEHWMDIGFQRKNPTTDLRGCGMFGLIQLLAFVDQHKDLAQDVFSISQDPIQEFPFACVGLNFSSVSIELLENDKLNALINQFSKKESFGVYHAVNLVYFSIFYDFLRTWRKDNLTLKDYGTYKKRIKKEANKSIKKLIKNFRNRKSLKNKEEDKKLKMKKSDDTRELDEFSKI